MDVFQRAGVSFVSVTQNFSTADAMGRLTLNMLMSFAEFEREMIADGRASKMAAARKKGKWIGGRVPLGYRVEGGKLVIHEDEAVLVRKASGLPRGEVARRHRRCPECPRSATKKCITRTGKHTAASAGTRAASTANSRTRSTSARSTSRARSTKASTRPSSTSNVRPRAAAPQPGADASGDRRCRLDFLLRGLLRCRVCGSAMTPRWSSSRGREYRYYVCTGLEQWTQHVRPLGAGSAIEEFVVKQIRSVVEKPDDAGTRDRYPAAATQPAPRDRAGAGTAHRRAPTMPRGRQAGAPGHWRGTRARAAWWPSACPSSMNRPSSSSVAWPRFVTSSP